MNVATTSSKSPEAIRHEVTRVLKNLTIAGVAFDRDPTSPWIVWVEVQSPIFDRFIKNAAYDAPLFLSPPQSPFAQTSDVFDEADTVQMPPLSAQTPMSPMDSAIGHSPMDDSLMESSSPMSPDRQDYRHLEKRRVSTPFQQQALVKGVVVFQVEVCRLPRLNMHGLHLKRISGSVWSYKKICNKLLSLIQL
jgi:hypothetical protein